MKTHLPFLFFFYCNKYLRKHIQEPSAWCLLNETLPSSILINDSQYCSPLSVWIWRIWRTSPRSGSAASSLCWVCWRTLCMRTRSCTTACVCCCSCSTPARSWPTSCWTTAYSTCSSTRCPPSTAWRTGNVQYLTSLAMFTWTLFASIRVNSFWLMNPNAVFTWTLNKVIRLICAFICHNLLIRFNLLTCAHCMNIQGSPLLLHTVLKSTFDIYLLRV